jgi:streptogramin lyase
LLGNKIGTVDKDTLEVTEFETPHKGPRRIRFGPDGTLWIPSFDEGYLMRFDPRTKQFESIKLPVLGEGEQEMPYVLNVHQKTGRYGRSGGRPDGGSCLSAHRAAR